MRNRPKNATGFLHPQKKFLNFLVFSVSVLIAAAAALAFHFSYVFFGLSFFHILLAVLVVALAYIVFKRPWIGYIFLISSLPFRSFSIVSVGEASVRISEAIFVLVALAWLLSLLLNKNKIQRSEIDLPLIIFFLWILLSFFWSSNITAAFVQSSRILFGMMFYFLSLQFIVTEHRLRLVTNVWIIVGFIIALIAVFEFLIFGFPNLIQTSATEASLFTRSVRSSVFLSPTLLSSYLNLCIFLLIGRLLGTKKKINMVFLIGVFLILFFALIFSFSRGGWVGFIIGSAYILYKMRALKRFVVFGLIILLIFIIIGGGIIERVVTERLASFASPTEDRAFQERLMLWRATKKMILEQPFLGVGIGNSPDMYEKLYHYYPSIFRYTHNLYLNITAELGLIGLALFVWLCISVAKAVSNFLKRIESREHKIVLYPFIAGYVAYLVHGLLHFHLAERHIWAFLGIGMAVIQMYSSEKNKG